MELPGHEMYKRLVGGTVKSDEINTIKIIVKLVDVQEKTAVLEIKFQHQEQESLACSETFVVAKGCTITLAELANVFHFYFNGDPVKSGLSQRLKGV